MNKVILMGRLTRDPEVRYSQAAEPTAVANFSLAVDRFPKPRNENEATADFLNCVAFGKQGEFVEKYLKQGTKVVVAGSIHNNNYTDRNGNKVYATQIRVSEIEFAESKAAASGGSGATAQQPAQQAASTSSVANNGGFMEIPDGIEDELPFK